MDRRKFIGSLASTTAGLAAATHLLMPTRAAMALESKPASTGVAHASEFDALTKRLLVDWCDGMMARQIHAPENPALHGALACPACEHIHGRCSDALYPFMHMAHVTGDSKYLTAAIDVYDWAENNVRQPDGSWTNDINPKSWRGTSIFGAIALAEALHYHGEILDEARREAWTARLDEVVGKYLYRDFKTIDFTNLNYGMTGVYGFHLFGEMLNNPKYTARSEQFARRVKDFFTEPNTLLWGEGKPNDNRSGRGLLPVDLGYNVEESLNGVVLYALEVDDQEMLSLVVDSLNGHLEFMLPDGAWDNSWGTRSQKWSYWGSRTSDGCQPAFSLMAGYNPAFGTAAIKNAELLERCTSDGLIHGGPHYVSHGIAPCIHHTFAHAKVMALVQDRMHAMPKVDASTPLPRQVARGVKHFPELDVWLAAKGPWRATVSAYDSIYKTKSADHMQQPSGGSLAVLYHENVGTLLAGSMARYVMVEPLNMQPMPGEDFSFTPRIEVQDRANDDRAEQENVNQESVDQDSGEWFTNLYDLKADVTYTEDDDQIAFKVKTTLQDRDRNVLGQANADYELSYQFTQDSVVVSAAAAGGGDLDSRATVVIPIISPSGEPVRQVSENRIEIDKPGGTVVVQCNVPMTIKATPKGRVFNMVPGAEAVPILASLSPLASLPRLASGDVAPLRCEISVIQ